MIIGIYDFFDLDTLEMTCPEDKQVEDGEMVVFKNDEGAEEIGKVMYFSENSKNKDKLKMNAKLLRKATAHDLQKFEANKDRGGSAVEECQKLAVQYSLDMQPFYALYSFDGLRVNVVFTAEDRVDFRELVKDLAKVLQKQIHLKQIGPRDKAKITDGYGRCGRRFCCKGFLPRMESVSMDMVRVQSLESKGSGKLSGACGKLLCCLRYEVEAYKELRGNLPSTGSRVKLKKAVLGSHDEGTVVSLDILNQKLKLQVGPRDYVTVELSDVDKVTTRPMNTAQGGMGARGGSRGGASSAGPGAGAGKPNQSK
jgi:cell fate regulator YaaT (PSP1 superfamily)